MVVKLPFLLVNMNIIICTLRKEVKIRHARKRRSNDKRRN